MQISNEIRYAHAPHSHIHRLHLSFSYACIFCGFSHFTCITLTLKAARKNVMWMAREEVKGGCNTHNWIMGLTKKRENINHICFTHTHPFMKDATKCCFLLFRGGISYFCHENDVWGVRAWVPKANTENKNIFACRTVHTPVIHKLVSFPRQWKNRDPYWIQYFSEKNWTTTTIKCKECVASTYEHKWRERKTGSTGSVCC